MPNRAAYHHSSPLRTAGVSRSAVQSAIRNPQSAIACGRAARGITLLELLAVMALIGVLLAMSVGVYIRMSNRFKEQGAASAVDVAIRQAHSSAISSGAPGFVAIDVKTRSVVPWAYRTVGMWHFEDKNGYGKTSGPYHAAILRGASLFPDGKIGKCVRLTEGSCVDAGADPDFDCDDGGYIEGYIRPATYTFTGDNYIFYKKNAYYLKIARAGMLEGNVGKVTVKAPNYHIVPGRWTKVGLVWSPQSTCVLVDDAIVGVGAGSRPPITEYPFLIGHDTVSMEGLVDEVRIMSAVVGNAVHLPPNYEIAHTAAPWNAIHFAADGSLDMRYHPGPVSVMITTGRKQRTIDVSMFGQVSRSELEIAEPKQPIASAAPATPTKAKPPPPPTAVLTPAEDPNKPSKAVVKKEAEEPNEPSVFGIRPPAKKAEEAPQ
ncbi:MAG TPA: type II secretion system protein [Planctomycetota bacterium]|jgi:prepilin-type N-terminal cleavage/methylation domain-containing protein